MKKVNQINLLYDYYGQLLTERQGTIIELYYGNDYSLGEIAERFAVSRQSVHDILKRSVQSLYRFEEKLGLVNNSLYQREQLSAALKYLDDCSGPDINKAKQILSHIIHEG